MPIRRLLAILTLGLSAGSIATASYAAPVPAPCPADPGLAELAAASDIILVGAMAVPRQHLAEEAQKPTPDYLDIPIRIDKVLKGGAAESAVLRFYPRDAPYQPSIHAVLDLADAPALLFLKGGGQEPGLYFAGYSPDALRPATDREVSAAKAEVARQIQIARVWRADAGLPHFAEVRGLVGRLGRVGGEEQQRVFARIGALGTAAVPAIIAQMDDRRSLKTPAIDLVNQPGSFEGIRHYGPEQVVDALAAILNQITGASFGSIENGGSARERDAAVAGWRVYASDLRCGKPG